MLIYQIISIGLRTIIFVLLAIAIIIDNDNTHRAIAIFIAIAVIIASFPDAVNKFLMMEI